jgi:hypothetical protein
MYQQRGENTGDDKHGARGKNAMTPPRVELVFIKHRVGTVASEPTPTLEDFPIYLLGLDAFSERHDSSL